MPSTSREQTLNKLGPFIYEAHFAIMAGFAAALVAAFVSEARRNQAARATRRR